jgi:hypothetical protein
VIAISFVSQTVASLVPLALFLPALAVLYWTVQPGGGSNEYGAPVAAATNS